MAASDPDDTSDAPPSYPRLLGRITFGSRAHFVPIQRRNWPLVAANRTIRQGQLSFRELVAQVDVVLALAPMWRESRELSVPQVDAVLDSARQVLHRSVQVHFEFQRRGHTGIAVTHLRHLFELTHLGIDPGIDDHPGAWDQDLPLPAWLQPPLWVSWVRHDQGTLGPTLRPFEEADGFSVSASAVNARAARCIAAAYVTAIAASAVNARASRWTAAAYIDEVLSHGFPLVRARRQTDLPLDAATLLATQHNAFLDGSLDSYHNITIEESNMVSGASQLEGYIRALSTRRSYQGLPCLAHRTASSIAARLRRRVTRDEHTHSEVIAARYFLHCLPTRVIRCAVRQLSRDLRDRLD